MNSESSSSCKGKCPWTVVLTSRRIILTACILITLGYVLMSGPGSTESSFNPDIFSPVRIGIAPMLCLAGYLLIIVGILKKTAPKDLPSQKK